jgi:hypothetical protein
MRRVGPRTDAPRPPAPRCPSGAPQNIVGLSCLRWRRGRGAPLKFRFDALGCYLIGRRLAQLPKEYFRLHSAAVRALALADCETVASWMGYDNSWLQRLATLRAGVIHKKIKRHDQFPIAAHKLKPANRGAFCVRRDRYGTKLPEILLAHLIGLLAMEPVQEGWPLSV